MRAESSRRIIKLGLTNFWRNRWLSFTATLIMTLTLLIVSFFAISNLAISRETKTIREKMDVSVYFNDSASTTQITDMQKQLASRTDIRQIAYVSKEEALVACKKDIVCNRTITANNSTENPLPRSLQIKPDQAESLPQIADFLKQEQFKSIVQKISYQDNSQIVDRLVGITSFTREFGWLVCLVFIFISILVVINTIRLTMFTRRDEIEIMRLVGANDAFIKIPFLIEGLIYGILATILAVGLVWAGVALILPRVSHYLGATSSIALMTFFYNNFWLMFGLELIVGVAIGICCSLIIIRKHLKF